MNPYPVRPWREEFWRALNSGLCLVLLVVLTQALIVSLFQLGA